MDTRALTQPQNKEMSYNMSPSIHDNAQFGTPQEEHIHVMNF